MLLARMLAEWRKQKEIPIRTLANKIGVTYNALWRFENGKEIEASSLGLIIRWVLAKSA